MFELWLQVKRAGARIGESLAVSGLRFRIKVCFDKF